MTRRAIPWRRPCETTDTRWQGNPITVTVGMYVNVDVTEEGELDVSLQPAEVFADVSYKVQPVVHGTLSDACVGVSLSLQHGIAPAVLAKSLGTVPFWQIGQDGQMEMVDAPASPIGPVVAEVVKAGGAS